MSKFDVEVEKSGNAWDELVEKADHTTIFHEWKWLKIAEKASRTKLLPLVVRKNTTPVALYPVFLGKKLGLKLAFSPPPRAVMVYLGPAIVSYEKLKQSKRESTTIEVVNAVDDFLKDLGVDYARVRTPPFFDDSRAFSWRNYSVSPQFTYVLNLSNGLKRLWENLDRSLRRSIEKSKQKGVSVREGNFDDLERIRQNMKARFQELGVKVSEDYHKEYFRDLFKEFHPDKMKILSVEYNGESVGGIVLLCHKNRVSYWFGMGKTTIKGIYPNDVLQWEAIKWSLENGFRYYEEIDAGDDPRLRHYKSKFNPSLVPWYSAVKRYSLFGRVAESVSKALGKGW